MRVHHKQPTIVSMWMLDVFCCALGCVTLLWLLNTRFASEKAETAQAAVRELLQTQTDREAIQQQLSGVRTDLDASRQKYEAEIRALTFRLGEVGTAKQKVEVDLKDLTAQLAVKTKEQADLSRDLADRKERMARSDRDLSELRGKIDQYANDIAQLNTKLKTSDEKLAVSQKQLEDTRGQFASASDKVRTTQTQVADLTAKLAASNTSVEKLSRLLNEKSEQRTAAEKSMADLQAKAASLENQLREALKDASTAKTSTTRNATDLAMANSQIRDLEKRLADSKAMLVDLQGDKSKLSDKFDRLQKESENRFAGITMTGKRVVFMVDRSGSMDRTSEQMLAPTKWPAVAETVSKVMRTLPDLQEFQVIVFSKQAQWLLGNGEWLPYAGVKSAEEVKAALLRTKVEGDTNLFSGFELAFRLREKGLDTIYLFSDGLPTSGPGVSDELLRRTPPPSVSEQTETLARHVRTQLTTVWNRAFTNQPKVRINAIGFFYESPDLGAFLWALARDNDGSFVGMSRP